MVPGLGELAEGQSPEATCWHSGTQAVGGLPLGVVRAVGAPPPRPHLLLTLVPLASGSYYRLSASQNIYGTTSPAYHQYDGTQCLTFSVKQVAPFSGPTPDNASGTWRMSLARLTATVWGALTRCSDEHTSFISPTSTGGMRASNKQSQHFYQILCIQLGVLLLPLSIEKFTGNHQQFFFKLDTLLAVLQDHWVAKLPLSCAIGVSCAY